MWLGGFPKYLVGSTLKDHAALCLTDFFDIDVKDAVKFYARDMATSVKVSFPDDSSASAALRRFMQSDDKPVFLHHGITHVLRLRPDKLPSERAAGRALGKLYQDIPALLKTKGLLV